MNDKVKKMTTISMLCAIAYTAMVLCRIPIVPMLDFLKYEPKDVIIAIAGFIYGPLTSFIVSAIVSLIEMLTVSATGPIGCVMNILTSCSFTCTAAFIYKRRKTLSGAVIGLVTGCLFMTAVMLLWNYLVTPIYMGYPREAVAKLLIPAFLPFNLLKSGLNAAFTMLLYKPIVAALRKTRLIPASENKENPALGVMLISAVVLITCVLFALVMKGII